MLDSTTPRDRAVTRWLRRALAPAMVAAALVAGTVGCSAPTDAQTDATDDALVTGLRDTASVEGTANKQVLAAVKDFEAAGGTGGWFRSVSPFDGAKGDYYLVKTLPANARPKAKLLLLRIEHQRAFLQGMLDKGVPIVLGTIAEETQVVAAALGGLPLADDAVRIGKIGSTKNIVLLQPSATKMTVAHEYRHWRDYEDATFEKSFATTMKPWLDADYIPKDDRDYLLRLVWEVRGHATQRLQALDDAAAKLAYMDRAGNVVEGPPKELTSAYDFEAGDAMSIFQQAYQSDILRLTNRIKSHDGKTGLTKFLAAISKFDLDDPRNELTFKRFVPTG